MARPDPVLPTAAASAEPDIPAELPGTPGTIPPPPGAELAAPATDWPAATGSVAAAAGEPTTAAPDPAPAPTADLAAPAGATAVAAVAPATTAAPDPDGFAALGLAEGMLATLAGLGYEEPTPIQREAIPPILAGRDVLGEAPTGTGKTAAFSLPLLQRLFGPPPIAASGPGPGHAPSAGATAEGPAPAAATATGAASAGAPAEGPAPAAATATGAASAGAPAVTPAPRRPTGKREVRGLILVPTRELAMQVAEALHGYGASLGVRVLAVYGGQPIGQQLRAIERGIDVVVATPGRAVDHLTRGSLKLGAVSLVVLDEADEMLDMGFAEDLETILSGIPAERQTALFSATVSPAIGAIARKHLKDPVHVRVRAARSAGGTTVSTIRQLAYVVRRTDKLAALCRVLDVEDPSSALVFGRTRGEVDELAEQLERRGHDAAALHGGMSQDQRDRVMTRFRDGTLDVLVATDVAARGLDIEHVSHVVNYDVPTDTDAYVHRIGRTGRAGRDGVAITLLEPREHRLLRDIERVTGVKVELAHVPTVADLRERRLELLRASLREALLQEGLERFRAVIEPLTEEFDIVEIALAAVSLHAGATTVASDEVEIPTLSIGQPPVQRDRRGKPVGPAVPPFPGRPNGAPWMPGSQGAPTGPGGPSGPPPAPPEDGWARLWVGGGRRIGMRPGDLVGAIANEAGLPASAIGRIIIGEGSSLVDVREDSADLVIGSLTGARIRGRALEVRRDAGPRPGPGQSMGPSGPGHAPGRAGLGRPAAGRPPYPRAGGPRPPAPRAGFGPGPGQPRPPSRGPGPWSSTGPRPPRPPRPNG